MVSGRRAASHYTSDMVGGGGGGGGGGVRHIWHIFPSIYTDSQSTINALGWLRFSLILLFSSQIFHEGHRYKS